MSRVVYLVASTETQGIKDAEARGWTRIARDRFVTPDKDDVRVVWRLEDLSVMPGGTPLMKGSDYETGPWNPWLGSDEKPGEKARFDGFVKDGAGQWIEF